MVLRLICLATLVVLVVADVRVFVTHGSLAGAAMVWTTPIVLFLVAHILAPWLARPATTVVHISLVDPATHPATPAAHDDAALAATH